MSNKPLSNHPGAVAARYYRDLAKAEGRYKPQQHKPLTAEQLAKKALKAKERRSREKAELERLRALEASVSVSAKGGNNE